MSRLFLFSLFVISIACSSQTIARDSAYPEEWWKAVPRDGAPAWEILPQDAGPGEVVLSKRNELGILSNFAPTPFEYDGRRYGSLEGFWQMMKYPEGSSDERVQKSVEWEFTREEVGRMTAYDAKSAGAKANVNMKKLGIKWVTYNGKKIEYLERAKSDFYKLIFAAEMAKMEQNPKVKEVLKKTGNLKLIPDHKQAPDSAPAWKYHEIWMEIRSTL